MIQTRTRIPAETKPQPLGWTRHRNPLTRWGPDVIVAVVLGILFIIPFIFLILTAAKTRAEALLFEFSLPKQFLLLENLWEVITFDDNRMILALKNSLVITLVSEALIILFSAMVAYVLQRRQDRVASIVGSLLLAGIIIPPAVVPTIFVLQYLKIYKTLLGMILVQVAFSMPFAIVTLRAFIGTIPRELDEAAIMDGASPLRVFFSIILPLLRPAIITVFLVSGVGIYNDFAGPLYFLPGSENVTAQLTLFTFMSQFLSQWNLLFANVIVVTIPPLILYIFFQRQIVAGMTAGSVKG